MSIRSLGIIAILLSVFNIGCSFAGQPYYDAQIYVDVMKNGKVIESNAMPLREMIAGNDKANSLKLGEIEIFAEFIIHHKGYDHYRIRYSCEDENDVLEVKFDGSAKTAVLDNENYSVFIVPIR